MLARVAVVHEARAGLTAIPERSKPRRQAEAEQAYEQRHFVVDWEP